MDATSCGVLCQHPGCWATRRRQEKGLARSLPPLKFDEDSSDDEIKLPTQSICNLLEDYGESPTDRYPMSTGGRPSHSVEDPGTVPMLQSHSFHSSLKLGVPHNTTASILSKPPRTTKRSVKRNPRLRLVEVQEVFDRDDLRAQWDETFVTKQYYVWMPNPGKRRSHLPREYKDEIGVSTAQTNPVLMKDLTECMIPSEIEQKREETILFDEFPVLKKRQPTKSPGKTPRITQTSQDANVDGQIDRDGINELLALPKDMLMKVLEHTKKSDFTSPGRLHAIVQDVAQDDERIRLALGARHSFQHKELQAADKKVGRHQVAGTQHYYDPSSTKPVYQLDTNADEDHGIIDRLSSINTPVKKKRPRPVEDMRGALDEGERPESEADSVETFPRYVHPLPAITEPLGHPKPVVSTQRVLHYRGKIPSISLGLPELPSGIKTTKAFSYKKQDLDFSLGPVITPPSSYRSSEGVAYSDHGTTLKVNVSSTMPGIPDSQYRDDDILAIHRVSPALSTNVPVPPAGTPATFAHGSPTKSAPAGPLQQQYSWDTTRITINWSQSALPPSPGMARGDSAQVARLLSTPQRDGEGEALEMEPTFEERALDTINETAREGPPADMMEETTLTEADQRKRAAVQAPKAVKGGMQQPPVLHLETSTLKRIGAGESPRQKSARSVESCPSPEQWPLISESSFENIPRKSVSEPALSARSDRRRPISRDSRKDFAARRAMDDNKMKTESPAPPPPSPEPKDHTGESRMRKDLRSRDSLTMAPLFEVAELDEGSPRDNQNLHNKRHASHFSRTIGGKYSKKIEVTVPAESEDVGKDEDKDSEDKSEMISQMTVMHVIPKGRAPGERRTGEAERVQETFLNVDIPAEDVSSLKAEHGSSHQEDISSNDTVVKSHTTGSEVSVSPRIQLPVVTEDRDQDGDARGQGPEQMEQQERVAEGVVEVSARDKSLVDVPNSHRNMLDVSNESLELLCDSARFISHEQVSPVEGETNEGDLGGSHRFALGSLEGLGEDTTENDGGGKLTGNRGRKESLLGNLTRRLDSSGRSDNNTEETKDEESTYGDGEGAVSGVGEEAKPSEVDIQPPGVFFFQGSSPSESLDGVQPGQEKVKEETDITKAPLEEPAGDGETGTENTDIVSNKENKEESETEKIEENIAGASVKEKPDSEDVLQQQDSSTSKERSHVEMSEPEAATGDDLCAQKKEDENLDISSTEIAEPKTSIEIDMNNQKNENEITDTDGEDLKLETENENISVNVDQTSVENAGEIDQANIKEENVNKSNMELGNKSSTNDSEMQGMGDPNTQEAETEKNETEDIREEAKENEPNMAEAQNVES